jgi:transcriptional regulator
MPTRRQHMLELLENGPVTVRMLAASLEIRVKDVVDDLSHLRHSLGKRLQVGPSECEACGHTVRRDTRFSAPSRCPRCKSERTSEPELWVE